MGQHRRGRVLKWGLGRAEPAWRAAARRGDASHLARLTPGLLLVLLPLCRPRNVREASKMLRAADTLPPALKRAPASNANANAIAAHPSRRCTALLPRVSFPPWCCSAPPHARRIPVVKRSTSILALGPAASPTPTPTSSPPCPRRSTSPTRSVYHRNDRRPRESDEFVVRSDSNGAGVCARSVFATGTCIVRSLRAMYLKSRRVYIANGNNVTASVVDVFLDTRYVLGFSPAAFQKLQAVLGTIDNVTYHLV
ncbi:hypothetical protein B0H17DRAFT_307446 [Mycena rosella]|uniref:Uncharacterized protein n=1 Tax=Mycena rosella TaxID=1033263 RepID=A0AAD7GKI8_MYCRO|nr:hypothetical protein B0H17DRAFT_307446 [Mycena rosella]